MTDLQLLAYTHSFICFIRFIIARHFFEKENKKGTTFLYLDQIKVIKFRRPKITTTLNYTHPNNCLEYNKPNALTQQNKKINRKKIGEITMKDHKQNVSE